MSEYPLNYCSHTPDLTSPIKHNGLSPHRSQTFHAKWTCLNFIERIIDFEKDLDDVHEIGACLIFSASDVTFYIHDVSSYAPDMISFSGSTKNGEKLKLFQHISQLNVLLVALEKRGEEPIRIELKLKSATEKQH